MKEIVTLTMNPAVDKSSTAPRVVPEDKLRCSKPSFESGGGGVNVSRALAKLGGSSTLILPAGGHSGKLLENLLRAENQRTVIVPIEGPTRENLTVMDESTEVQYRFVMPGPEITAHERAKIEETITELSPQPEFLVISGSLPPGTDPAFYPSLIQTANAEGIKVILDTSGDPLEAALQESVFLIKPNLGEFSGLAGEELNEEPKQIDFARKLIDRGSTRAIVISIGAGGALLVTEDTARHFRSPTVPIVSKVGAGDSMVAGITYGLATDHTLTESVRLGVAAGASAVMTEGTELCRKEDTFRLWEQTSG